MDPLKLLIYVDSSLAARRAVQLVAPLVSAGAAEAILLASEGDVDQAKGLLDEATTLLGGGANIQRRVRTGPLEAALVAEARERQSDLVVVAPPGRAGWRRWLQGAQPRSLAQHLPTSALLVRGRPVTGAIQNALIAGGGGRSMRDDAAMAARLLAPQGGQATVCHVLSQVPLIYGPLGTDEQLTEQFMSSGAPEVENLTAAVRILTQAGVRAQLKLRVGVVVDEVLEELQQGGYDMLAIGAHQAASMLDRLLLEDLSANLLLKSPVPVLLVRPREGLDARK
jgi:nucleotide-binding universal stress UspA family protein